MRMPAITFPNDITVGTRSLADHSQAPFLASTHNQMKRPSTNATTSVIYHANITAPFLSRSLCSGPVVVHLLPNFPRLAGSGSIRATTRPIRKPISTRRNNKQIFPEAIWCRREESNLRPTDYEGAKIVFEGVGGCLKLFEKSLFCLRFSLKAA